MSFLFKYFRTWLIIKKKQLLNLFPRSENNYTRYAIICAPRCGSNWLHTLLNSHPNIVSYGEILRKTHVNNPSQNLPTLNELVFHPHSPSIKAVGLKLFYSYLNDEKFCTSFQEALDDTDITIIHLIRKDILAQYTSLKRAKENQRWSQARPYDKTKPMYIDPEEFKAHRKELGDNKHKIKRTFKNHAFLEISYEDLNENLDERLIEVQQFLGVKPRKLFSLLRKQAAGSLKDQIKNRTDFRDIN